jgi:hypothetical protein
MSTTAAIGAAGAVTPDAERGHRIRIWLMSLTSIGLVTALTIYGFDYYWKDVADRPL